jgi:hypothetical protein
MKKKKNKITFTYDEFIESEWSASDEDKINQYKGMTVLQAWRSFEDERDLEWLLMKLDKVAYYNRAKFAAIAAVYEAGMEKDGDKDRTKFLKWYIDYLNNIPDWEVDFVVDRWVRAKLANQFPYCGYNGCIQCAISYALMRGVKGKSICRAIRRVVEAPTADELIYVMNWETRHEWGDRGCSY